MRWCVGERGLDVGTTRVSHQPPEVACSTVASMLFFLALKHFCPVLIGQQALIKTDSTTAVSNISKQGGICSLALLRLSRSLILWCRVHSEPHMSPAALTSSRSSLQGRTSCERVEIAPTGGGSNMESFQQGRSGPIFLQGKHPLHLVLFHNRQQCASGDGCPSTPSLCCTCAPRWLAAHCMLICWEVQFEQSFQD